MHIAKADRLHGRSCCPPCHEPPCTSAVVPYQNGLATAAIWGAYAGGARSPLQDRIYFVPFGQAHQPTWHYVDCATGDIVPYQHGLATAAVSSAYNGGVFSPNENRTYFVPNWQADEPTWHYIDCA